MNLLKFIYYFLLKEEVNRLKQQIEEMIVEHNNVVLERNGLQQQCTQAVHKWDITLRERKELQEALKKVLNGFLNCQ